MLAERRLELLQALDRLDAKAEIGLRLVLDSPEDARARVASIAGAAPVLDTWHEIHADPAGRTVLEMVFLVSALDALALRERLREAAGEVTGPRPPRHFLPRFLRASVGTERRAMRASAPTRHTG
jgi:hypothetical protein